MAGFIKVVSADPHTNGASVNAKTYRALKEALLGKLRFGIIRAQGLGDVLMSAVVAEALKREHPSGEISFYAFAQYLPVLRRFPFIDRLGTLEEIDTTAVMIDLMGKIDYLPLCNKDHRLHLLADEAGVDRGLLNCDFSFSPTEEENCWAATFLKKLGAATKDVLIGIHLKSYAAIRTWDKNWDLVRLMLRRLPKVYKIAIFEKDFTETPKDIRSPRVLNLTGALSIFQLVPVISACALLVCPDSGLMHLAGMMRVPFISLFGPIDPDLRIRYYPTGESIWRKDEISCAPCWDWQTRSCKNKEHEFKQCMSNITPEAVLDRVVERLNAKRKEKSECLRS